MQGGVRSGTLIATVALAVGLVATGPAAAGSGTTFVVRSTGNGGDVNIGDDVCDADPVLGAVRCTLRAAIEEANADLDEDRITFRIGGSHATGVKVINVPEPVLPQIVAPLIIDGYSQPDSAANTRATGTDAKLRIVLDGPGTDASRGLDAVVPVLIRGLVIRDFGRGVYLAGTDSVVVGCFFGTDAAGRAGVGRALTHVDLESADRARIGGTARADRNLMGGPVIRAIYADQSTDVVVEGNLIGVGPAGGGTGPGPTYTALEIDAGVTGRIGGGSAASSNTIANADEDGIVMLDRTSIRVRVLRNRIVGNAQLGIDLSDDGPTDDDGADDPDTGPNDLQNRPSVTLARTSGGATEIRGTLLSRALHDYRVDVYANPAGTAQAASWLGRVTVTTNEMGFASWVLRPADPVALGRAITAIATDLAEGASSEISPPHVVTAS